MQVRKKPEGLPSGSFGPTTAGRMDSYVDQFQEAGGSMIMIAKGNRSQQVTDACKNMEASISDQLVVLLLSWQRIQLRMSSFLNTRNLVWRQYGRLKWKISPHSFLSTIRAMTSSSRLNLVVHLTHANDTSCQANNNLQNNYILKHKYNLRSN